MLRRAIGVMIVSCVPMLARADSEICSQVSQALNGPLPGALRTELSIIEHISPHFSIRTKSVTLWSNVGNPNSRKVSLLLNKPTAVNRLMCGNVQKLCQDAVGDIYYVVTTGKLSGTVIHVDSGLPEATVEFFTVSYAMKEENWGGECIESHRDRLKHMLASTHKASRG